MIVIDFSIANISIPYIAGSLGIATNDGTYVITSFAVGNALGLAMTGWLSKKIGPVKLILYSILLFTAFSWFCGLALNIQALVMSRFLQGFFGGPISPSLPKYDRHLWNRKKQAKRSGHLGADPHHRSDFGPLAGGYITYWYSWPWIFYINIPIGIFCALVIGSHPAGRKRVQGETADRYSGDDFAGDWGDMPSDFSR